MVAATPIFLLLTLHMVLVASVPLGSGRRCTPIQWEGAVLGTIGQTMRGRAQVLEIAGTISADYKIHRQAFSALVYRNGQMVANTTVLTTEKALYGIDNVNKRCIVLPGIKVNQICSDSAELQYKTSLKIGNQMTDTYALKLGGTAKITLTMLRDSFTPVSQVAEQNIRGLQQLTVLAFGNTTVGIKDPSVFKIPSFCLKTVVKRDASAEHYINPLV